MWAPCLAKSGRGSDELICWWASALRFSFFLPGFRRQSIQKSRHGICRFHCRADLCTRMTMVMVVHGASWCWCPLRKDRCCLGAGGVHGCRDVCSTDLGMWSIETCCYRLRLRPSERMFLRWVLLVGLAFSDCHLMNVSDVSGGGAIKPI